MLVSRNVFDFDPLLTRRFVPGNFLQSKVWKSFLDKQKIKWWQLSVTDDLEKPVAVCLLYEKKLFLGKSYLYSPKGPIWLADNLSTGEKQEALELILSQIRDITIATHDREELFCKIEPEDSIPQPPTLVKSQNVQPAHTWVLDLDKDNKQLLGDMHAKTRYNIALSQRRGVRVVVSTKAEDLKHFLKLLPGTTKRQKIKAHSNKHYHGLWQTLIEHQVGKLYLAEIDGKVVAANILIIFGKATTYLHGVSDYNYRQTMAPYALQWQAIKDAKEQGQHVYDFWGITNSAGFPRNWQGITRFKQGFGGREITSPGSYNFIYNKQWYSFYLKAKHWKNIFKK